MIDYPSAPIFFSLDKYPSLRENWEFSLHKLKDLNQAIEESIDIEDISIVTAGSFGRLEASSLSDLDYMILATKPDDRNLNEVREKLIKICNRLEIALPNPTGVFSEIVPIKEMVEITGDIKDVLNILAQRLLILMEARPIYNSSYFTSVVDTILKKYLDYVIKDPEKECIFLLNDLVRYFRSICVNYQANFWKENEKWVIRNIKLRHSRVILYAGLLLIILNASKKRKCEDSKVDYISQHIYHTPLEKIIHVYKDNNDSSYFKILESYNSFLYKISNPDIRKLLNAEYCDRHSNIYYTDLKITSDALQTELTRFIFSQRHVWTDQIFEYLLF